MPPGIQEMTREELLGVVGSLYHENQNLKKLIFGAKSERFIPASENTQQGTLDFGEVPEDKKEEPEQETITYTLSLIHISEPTRPY